MYVFSHSWQPPRGAQMKLFWAFPALYPGVSGRSGTTRAGEDGVGCDGGADRALDAAASRDIEHIRSAHNHAGLEVIKAAGRQRLTAGQDELDLGPGSGRSPGRLLPITPSRMVTCTTR